MTKCNETFKCCYSIATLVIVCAIDYSVWKATIIRKTKLHPHFLHSVIEIRKYTSGQSGGSWHKHHCHVMPPPHTHTLLLSSPEWDNDVKMATKTHILLKKNIYCLKQNHLKS